MNFWDSSAILPLLVQEQATPAMRALYAEDHEIVAWWGTTVECVSAPTRLEREGRQEPAAVSASIRQLAALAHEWDEVQPVDAVRKTAARLLRVHSLQAADSLQLTAEVAPFV